MDTTAHAGEVPAGERGSPDAVPSQEESQDRPPVLRLVGLRQSVPDGNDRRTVLDGVDLEVHGGELVVLMGPSGSGKTTLLRVAAGLDRPEHGMPVVEGSHLWVLPPAELADLRRRSVGYVEQRWNLLDSLTVVRPTAVVEWMRR